MEQQKNAAEPAYVDPAVAAKRRDAQRIAAAREREGMDAEQREKFETWILPLILLGMGLLLELAAAVALGPSAYEYTGYASMGLGKWQFVLAILVLDAVRIVLTVPLLFVGLLVCVGLLGSAFGTLIPAVLKLFAIAALIIACGTTIDLGLDIVTQGFGGIGFWIQIALLYGLFWGLAAWLFDMEPLEITIMFVILIFGPAVALFIIGGTIVAMFF